MVNQERLKELFIDLCRIPSPSGEEAEVSAYIQKQLRAAGIAYREDDAATALNGNCGNLHVHITPDHALSNHLNSSPIFFAAHMDTVPPDVINGQVPVVIEGDRIHTKGKSVLGGDDKLGVAAALEIVLSHSEGTISFPRSVDIVFTVQEEVGARGAGYFDVTALEASHGFILDGEHGLGTAINKAPAKYRYSIDIQGTRSHAAVDPDQGRNAIVAAAAIATQLPQGRIGQIGTGNVASINGGGATNIVPDHADIIGELRGWDDVLLTKIKDQIENDIGRVCRTHEVTAKTTWEPLYFNYSVSEDASVIQEYNRVCQELALPVAFVSSLGGGDANPFNNKGCLCIVIGMAMHNIHSKEEFVRIPELFDAAHLLATLIEGTKT